LRFIRQYCGEIDVEALAKLNLLPDWHADWDRRNYRTNLDVRGTDQAHVQQPLEPLASQRLEVGDALPMTVSQQPIRSLLVCAAYPRGKLKHA
jgi:hypothetical protein